MAATAVLTSFLTALSACGGTEGSGSGATQAAGRAARTHAATADPTSVPGVGDRLQRRIPSGSRQVVAVYGDGKDSAVSTVVLYSKHGSAWQRERGWAGHNGKKGWTTDHHEDDDRSPVGVFTLSDAGGVLPNPGSGLPYTRSAAFAAPRWWAKSHWHDFDYVIAIDYNRRPGTTPLDWTRPLGAGRGGGIWLHVDHGGPTQGCVSLKKQHMRALLLALDPALHPVVVMGDAASLRE